MGIQSDIDMHFWITRGMARRVGLNLSEAIHQGFLSRTDFVQMIAACRKCGRTNSCLAVLSERSGGGEGLPDACPNAPILNSLRSLH
ncbi:DUF6455 family protein [Thioclava atlantica]|uniref:DUF6455 domain-containing protein n=1 Tax=Thioclava atlantica TaxID=1317124 RepID=A0A085U1B6_9RHOB|nr:DUF6455 family protein [Thioclava atlantica]KFE36763.1 hypothetical protein DW2_01355 [Thioclava atlantica]